MKLLKLTHANGRPVLIPLHHVAYVQEYTQLPEVGSIVYLVGNGYIAVVEKPAVVGRKMQAADQ